MPPRRSVEFTPHTFIGVSLAMLGVILTLDNLGFVEAQEVLRFWPTVPILVGAVYVVQGREMRDYILGTGWIAVGAAFLLRNLDVFRFRLSDFLPLLLVALGLKFMFGRRQRRERWPGMPDPSQPLPPLGVPPPFGPMGDAGFAPRFDGPFGGPFSGEGSTGPAGAAASSQSGAPGHVLRVFAMLQGAERRHRGTLAHVEVSAVMGGCDIDLRDATPTSEPLVIQVFAMWGGIDMRVPPGWLIQNEAWPILGGIVDSTTPPAVPTHRVILRGNAFMGGVEVKN
ncbi:MAG: DUF5668 domain-containing protein [Vicinamibacteraceae bacterium]